MYAVIKTGGKQYRVISGERLKVEKLEVEVGGVVTLDQILMVSDGESTTIGSPIINGATVKATVLSHGRGDKVMIFKFRRRKHYRKTQGHRQSFTEIQIGEILAAGQAAAKPVKAKAKAAKTAE
jgi:large subunit ribosomal protein L21